MSLLLLGNSMNAPRLSADARREQILDVAIQVFGRAGYYGAYQFSPTTWNMVASHSGRMDLIGVLPSQASAYDQDELAWSLYQWQGNRPWNGRC